MPFRVEGDALSADALNSRRAATALWTRAAERHATVDVVATADALLARLENSLRRWVGAEGFAALLSRAIALTAATHPALQRIPDLGLEPVAKQPTPEFTDDDTRDAVIVLVATLMDLLGRIIGSELAIRLLDQSEAPSPRGTVSNESEDAHDA